MNDYTFQVHIYPEIHCDQCNDIVHNHFDCPICKKKYAGINTYSDLSDKDLEIQCEECKTKFRKIDGFWYDNPTIKAINLIFPTQDGKVQTQG